MENSSRFEEEESTLRSPELDLDHVTDAVENSLKVAGELAQRLGDLNKEMVDYMYSYAQAKTSTK